MVTAGSKCPILVVEDEPLVSGYICEVLETFDFIVSGCASSGPEAIALAEQDRPRLAVIDIKLSGPANGIAVAQILRDQFDVPTIFLSGYWSDELIEQARAASPLALLAKPFLPSQLYDAVQQALVSNPSTPNPMATGGSESQRGQ
jgi:CheY-like chemotaxis protein